MQIQEDAYFGGNLQAKTFTPSPGCVSDSHVNAAAGIQATKLQHRYREVFRQDVLVAGTFCLHVVQSAVGTIKSFNVGVRTIGISGASTVATIDVKKNGTSIAPAATPIDLMGLAVVQGIVTKVLTSLSLSAGDWIDVVVAFTAGSGTLPTGLYACLEVDELPV